ncbi:hypothetical protein [Natronobiforma cellulositropha]|uniref:hypothetical protein n=1 Tax=Natronobiforma cellulositropha TaxID=1679076 RepID=UPI0021D5C861|nr:hypothetical protein [Natronobiforma cellulositropha]
MARQTQTRAVVATLSVRVPLGASGTLTDGVTAVVDRVPAVDAVADPQVQGLKPGLNDTVVEARLAVTIRTPVGDRGEDVALARRVLEDGVGILSVDSLERVAEEADGPVHAQTVGVG